MEPTVARIGTEHAAQARTVIARAFAEDPLIQWLFPATEWDAARRLDAIAMFYWPSVEAYAAAGTGHVAIDGRELVGVSLWSVPGLAVISDSATLPSDGEVASLLLGARLGDLSAGMRAARGTTDVPGTPYLHDLAVASERQGQGTGTTLVAAGLAEFGGNGAWLESTNGRNHGLYERAGFRVVHSDQLGDSGVTMTRMVKR